MSDLSDLVDQVITFAETSLALEEYDLHSADAASCVRYLLLRRLYVSRGYKLIEMIEEAGPRLREELANLLKDS